MAKKKNATTRAPFVFSAVIDPAISGFIEEGVGVRPEDLFQRALAVSTSMTLDENSERFIFTLKRRTHTPRRPAR